MKLVNTNDKTNKLLSGLIKHPFKRFFTSSFSFLFAVLLAIGLSIPGINAEETPAPPPAAEENFTITIKALYEGTNVEGIEFKLSGNGASGLITSSLSGDNKFTGLKSGSYSVEAVVDTDSDVELLANTPKTQTVNLSSSNQSETITFLFQKKAPPVDENFEKIKAIKLPENLTKIGSKTTDFSELEKTRLASVEGFTFDNPGVNKITYLEPINLSNYNDFSKITLISDYLDLETKGKVDFDTSLMPIFNKKARITMYGIKIYDIDEEKEVIIKRNDTVMENIGNLKYSGTELSFDAPGFSEYLLSPRIKLAIDQNQDKENIESDEDIYELTFLTDLADTEFTVTNNGEVINFPAMANAEGVLRGDLKLNSGENRIRIQGKFVNGEQVEEFLTIKYNKPQPQNNISNVFTILLFLVLIIAGIAIGIYYWKLKKKKEAQDKDKQVSEPVEEPEENKIAYNEDLLTDEEKALYGTTSSPKDDIQVESDKQKTSKREEKDIAVESEE